MGNCAPSANGATKSPDDDDNRSSLAKSTIESKPEPLPPHRRSISQNPLKRQNSIILKKEKALLPSTETILQQDSNNEQVEIYKRGNWQKGLRSIDNGEVTLHSGELILQDQVNTLDKNKNLRKRYEIEDEVRIPLQFGKDAGRVLKAMVLRKDKNDGTYWVRILSSKLSEKRGHVNKIIKVEHQHLLTNDAYKKQKRESKELQQAAMLTPTRESESGENAQVAGEAEEGSIIDLTPAGELEIDVSAEEVEDSQLSTPVVDLSETIEMSDVKKDMADVPPLTNDDTNESDNSEKLAGREETELASAAHSDLSE